MASTTNYGWSTPDDSAYVKDGASAIRTLGSAIDSTLKTQIDAQIPDSLLTTTGDIIYASGANTPARLGIGSNGQFLTVSGGLPTWGTAVSKDSLLGLTTTGTYVHTNSPTAPTASTPTVNTTYYTPVWLPAGTYDRLTLRTGSTFSGTGVVRLGIYNASGTTGRPTTVFLDGGTVSCTASNTDYSVTISQTITAGWYWLAFNSQTAAATNVFFRFDATSLPNIAGGYNSVNTITTTGYFSEASITGAFATAGTLTASTTSFITGIRFA